MILILKRQQEEDMNVAVNISQEKEFDAVAFFRNVKEKIAMATSGMTLQERRKWFQNIREGNADAIKRIIEI